jgi:hypothetical protein
VQYMLLIHDDPTRWATFGDEERAGFMQEFFDYTEELRESGAYVTGAQLQPASATTTVEVRDGETLTTDGPFAETKEQLGGYYLIDCDSLDEALEWAARNPNAQWGHVEVRPLMELPAEVSG